MPLPSFPTQPAAELLLSFTFFPGSAADPTMRFWLGNTQLDVPASIATTCRALAQWNDYYPDQQLRHVLVLLLAEGYTEAFTPYTLVPPAVPFYGHSLQVA